MRSVGIRPQSQSARARACLPFAAPPVARTRANDPQIRFTPRAFARLFHGRRERSVVRSPLHVSSGGGDDDDNVKSNNRRQPFSLRSAVSNPFTFPTLSLSHYIYIYIYRIYVQSVYKKKLGNFE